MARALPVGILVSGAGTTLEGLARRWAMPAASIEIAVVVADRSGIGAIERARRLGLPAEVVDRAHGVDAAWADRLTGRLRAYGVELVVLAGFLSILPEAWLLDWQGRALNLHPSLLPKYGGKGMHGLRVHAAVLAAHDAETGVTVHLVTSHVDGGPTIEQRRLPVRSDDTPQTLRARLAPLEVDALDRAVRRFADHQLPLPYV
ncbi:MAG: phosphoribosylglycinamide formyltransferase [Thermoplasmata archaeon]